MVDGCEIGAVEVQSPQIIFHVDADASGVGADGLSWATAFTHVQDALALVTRGDEIWVAEGTYYPDEGAGQSDNDRSATFQLVSNVGVYGGFAATETMRSERNPAVHQ